MKKEVNQNKQVNQLTLVLSFLKAGLNLSQIAEKLKVSPSYISRLIKPLKQKNIVKNVGYGTWDVRSEPLGGHGQVAFIKDRTIRGHGYRFRLVIPKLKNWSRRDFYLKHRNIPHEQKYGYQKLIIKGFNIKLYEKVIIIIFPKNRSYFGKIAKEVNYYAIQEFIKIIEKLERILNCSFAINRKYKYRIHRQHHSLVDNEVAKIYEEKKEKLEFRDRNNERRILVDNSFNLHELEAVNPKHAPSDITKVQLLLEDIIERGLTLSSLDKKQREFLKRITINAEGINNISILQTQLIQEFTKFIKKIK